MLDLLKGVPQVAAISRDEVAHLAALSRLALTENELDLYASQLDSILSHVQVIAAVTADVPATAAVSPTTNVTRPDEVGHCLPPDQALAGAPAVEDQRFRVPQILGEEQ